MTDKRRISEIRARCEAATPGRWVWFRDSILASEKGGFVLSSCLYNDGSELGYLDITQGDADFIAHAREDIPWLLDQLDKARAEIDQLKAAQRWIPVKEANT